jgi:hypothetical protein
MDNFNLKKLFCEWPSEIPRRGVVITSREEQIPFSGFLTQQGLLLIARPTPDTTGARIVILPYENIAGVKLTDVIDPKLFQNLGFAGSLS